MEKLLDKKLLYYNSSHDQNNELFITVEVTDERALPVEEPIIDKFLKKFYEDYNREMDEKLGEILELLKLEGYDE